MRPRCAAIVPSARSGVLVSGPKSGPSTPYVVPGDRPSGFVGQVERRFRLVLASLLWISAANIGPNRFHQNRTVSWLMSIPRSAKRTSTLRSDSGYLTYIITTRGMTSGELLKYRTAERLDGMPAGPQRHLRPVRDSELRSRPREIRARIEPPQQSRAHVELLREFRLRAGVGDTR